MNQTLWKENAKNGAAQALQLSARSSAHGSWWTLNPL